MPVLYLNSVKLVSPEILWSSYETVIYMRIFVGGLLKRRTAFEVESAIAITYVHFERVVFDQRLLFI